VFLCPGWANGADEGGSDRAGARGYAYNPYVSPDQKVDPYWASFTKISKIPKDRIIVVDGYMRLYGGLDQQFVRTNGKPFMNWQGKQVNTGGPFEYGIYMRHNNGANYLFTDMHAAWSNEYHKTGYATPGNKWYIDDKIFIAVREITEGDH
jgi:prepilin-type processing-associated H-X9-DG protein